MTRRDYSFDCRSLENFTFVDDMGKDQGINIRHKVTEMLEFIQVNCFHTRVVPVT